MLKRGEKQPRGMGGVRWVLFAMKVITNAALRARRNKRVY